MPNNMNKLFITAFIIIVAMVSMSFINNEDHVVATLIQQPTASITRGKAVYTQYCMPCHQVDGSGVPNMNPPLIKTTYVVGDKTRLLQIIVKGWNKGVEIDGEEYTNPMPAQALNNQQLADVTSYIRNSFGNKASAITLAEVKAIKAKLK